MIVITCITVSSAYDENCFDGENKEESVYEEVFPSSSISRDLQVFLFKIGRMQCIQRGKNLIPELFVNNEGGLHMFQHVSQHVQV